MDDKTKSFLASLSDEQRKMWEELQVEQAGIQQQTTGHHNTVVGQAGTFNLSC